VIEAVIEFLSQTFVSSGHFRLVQFCVRIMVRAPRTRVFGFRMRRLAPIRMLEARAVVPAAEPRLTLFPRKSAASINIQHQYKGWLRAARFRFKS
jgi:hypothetical protein